MSRPLNNSNDQPAPSEALHDEGEIDWDLSKKIKLAGHQWRQQGYWIVCKSCPLHHASYVGSDWWLNGIDEAGMPKFTRRK